jgi:flagellar assembly protein FliH
MASSSKEVRKPAFLDVVMHDSVTPVQFAHATETRRKERNPVAEAAAAAAATEKLETQAARNIERIEMALSLLRSQGERLAEQARSDALELAFLVARRILEHEISTDPGLLLSLLRTAIAKAGEGSRVAVHLNPKDLEIVRASQANDPSALTLMKVELVPDPSLGHGDCLVKTDLGTVDGRLSTRLQEMREAIGSALGGTST